nr:zinc finger, CCHC-type [Tanacetum cinerariifolium]
MYKEKFEATWKCGYRRKKNAVRSVLDIDRTRKKQKEGQGTFAKEKANQNKEKEAMGSASYGVLSIRALVDQIFHEETGRTIETNVTQKRETQITKGTRIGIKSNHILEEDDEPSLLMTTHKTEHEEVLLNEGQIQPRKYASGDASMWYLDNGANNHMTGTKSHFKDIDESVSSRIRHLNFDDINKMTRKGLVKGIPRINHAGQICDACLLGKQSRTPFLNQAKFRSKNPLDLVYGYLCGPISPATHSGLLEKAEKTKDLWEIVVKRVSSYIVNDPEGCLDVLSLSYDHLPCHLRNCFLYISGFPKDRKHEYKGLSGCGWLNGL